MYGALWKARSIFVVDDYLFLISFESRQQNANICVVNGKQVGGFYSAQIMKLFPVPGFTALLEKRSN